MGCSISSPHRGEGDRERFRSNSSINFLDIPFKAFTPKSSTKAKTTTTTTTTTASSRQSAFFPSTTTTSLNPKEEENSAGPASSPVTKTTISKGDVASSSPSRKRKQQDFDDGGAGKFKDKTINDEASEKKENLIREAVETIGELTRVSHLLSLPDDDDEDEDAAADEDEDPKYTEIVFKYVPKIRTVKPPRSPSVVTPPVIASLIQDGFFASASWHDDEEDSEAGEEEGEEESERPFNVVITYNDQSGNFHHFYKYPGDKPWIHKERTRVGHAFSVHREDTAASGSTLGVMVAGGMGGNITTDTPAKRNSSLSAPRRVLMMSYRVRAALVPGRQHHLISLPECKSFIGGSFFFFLLLLSLSLSRYHRIGGD